MNQFRRLTILAFTCLILTSQAFSQYYILKPKESHDILINPGMGFTTMHRFNMDHHGDEEPWSDQRVQELLLPNGDLKYCEYPPSSIAYFRWYWNKIEPEQEKYNWELIDSTIKQAEENQQKLALRIMPQNGEPKAPQWYREIAKGFTFNNGKSWMPDYEDPLYLKHYGRLITQLGKRYDGHPGIDHIDIGAIGRWGEWHTSQTGHPMPSMETQITFVDLYLSAFPDSLLTMLIGGGKALEHAVERGAGWRADCLGDMGGFSDNWNHMEDMYPIALARAHALDAWKKAPVAFESCWTMEHWVEQGWDVKAILERALKYHVSIFNNKSSTVPKQYWDEVNDFLRRMGYRFVIRRVQFPNDAKPGDKVHFEVLWENTGVAPCYHSYPIMYELKHEEEDYTYRIESTTDLRTMLPGYHLLEEDFTIPKDAPSGKYAMRAALVEPQRVDSLMAPAVDLAIEGKEKDGWYRLGNVWVE